MVLRSASKPLLLIFATIAAVRVPRSARFHIYTSVFPCSAALVRKRIATARLSPPARGFFLPHTLSSPNQLDRAARAWCVALKACPPSGEGTHGRLTRRVRGSSCAKKKRCALSRPGAEGEESDAPDQSRSKRHPVPAVQPATSSAAVQSLAPAAWQMASAWAKVWSRVHGQPASDAPHTEQPG